MHKSAQIPLWTLVLSVTAITFAATSLAQADGPASWAPADTVVLVEVPDFPKLMEQWKKTSFHRVVNDPQMKKMTAEITGKFDALLKDMVATLGLDSVEQLKVEPTGGAAFVLKLRVEAGADEPTPLMAVVADWGENDSKLQDSIKQAVAKAIELGSVKTTENFDGVTITTLTAGKKPSEPATPPAEPGQQTPPRVEVTTPGALAGIPIAAKTVSFATMGTVTAIGSDVALLKEIIKRVKNKGVDSLAQTKNYETLKKRCAPLGQINFFANLPLVIGMVAELNSKFKGQREALALDKIGAVVGTIAIAPKEHVSAELRGFVPVAGDRTGLAKLLTENVVNKPLLEDSPFPDSTIFAAWYNFKFETLLDEIYEIQRKTDPEGAEQFKAGLQIPISEEVTLDLEKLFKSFAMPLKIQFAMSPPYKSENVSMLLSLNHTNREAVAQLFSMPMLSPFMMKRDFLGQPVYDTFMMPGFSAALTDQALALGNTQGVEQLIRSAAGKGGPTLASDPQFQFAARMAPPTVWHGAYVDTHKFLTAALALHKQAKAAAEKEDGGQINLSYDMTGQFLKGMTGIPFDDIENPEELLKYAPIFLSTATSVPEGVLLYSNVTEPVGR